MENRILEKKGKDINYLTLDEIEKKHLSAINSEPYIYETKLSNINLHTDKSIILNSNNKYNELLINTKSFDNIISMNNFNKKTATNFTKILKDKDKSIELLNNFKNESIKNQGDKDIILVGDKNTHEIVSIFLKDKYFEIIKNKDFLYNTYNIIKKHNLKITDFYVNSIGEISINTMVDDNKPILINGLDSKFGIPENETFHRGFNFISNIGDSRIIPSTIRILCSNQITLANTEDLILFKNLNTQTIRKIDEFFENYKQINYVPQSFNRQVKQAFYTPASLSEFEHAIKIINNNTELTENDLNEYINYSEINDIFNIYSDKNKIVLSEQFKKQTPIDKTVWELINSMTYIASNMKTSQINDMQRKNLFIESGKILRGDSKNGMFDLQFQYNTPFSKKWL